MEHNDGSYGYPPYGGGNPPDGSDPYGGAPQDGQDPYAQAPYGNPGYQRSSYGYDVGEQSDEVDYTPRQGAARTPYRAGDELQRDDPSRVYYRRNDEVTDDEEPRPRPKKKKKKRSKFVRFMRALGLYLAQLPAKTLIVIGGSIAVVLVAVILLAVLLPGRNNTASPEEAGQLAISDLTPTPSLAPTFTPAPTAEPTPTADPDPLSGTRIEKVGETSDLMPDIQKRLVELGYMTEPDGGYTNKFGPATKTAIRLFQVKNFESSKDWDGIIGNGTYNMLMGEQAQPYYLARGDGDDRTKVITKLVEDVTALQTRLVTLGYLPAGSATGLYGSTTVTAVQKFQQYHGLLADGIAGQQTLKLINSADAMDATTGAANDRSKLSPSPGPDGAEASSAPATAEATPAP